MTELVVRPATAADADAIGRTQVTSWLRAYDALLPRETLAGMSIEAQQRIWRGWLARPTSRRTQTFVAERDGEVIGYVSVGEWLGSSEPHVGELYAIYLEPGHWGTGAGRALIERAEQALRELGFREARLWVMAGNERAERFYRAAGWRQDGRKEDLFQGAMVVELRYSKPL